MKIQLRQYENYPFLGGGQYRPVKGGHFAPEWRGQFQPVPLVTLLRFWVVNFTGFSRQALIGEKVKYIFKVTAFYFIDFSV